MLYSCNHMATVGIKELTYHNYHNYGNNVTIQINCVWFATKRQALVLTELQQRYVKNEPNLNGNKRSIPHTSRRHILLVWYRIRWLPWKSLYLFVQRMPRHKTRHKCYVQYLGTGCGLNCFHCCGIFGKTSLWFRHYTQRQHHQLVDGITTSDQHTNAHNNNEWITLYSNEADQQWRSLLSTNQNSAFLTMTVQARKPSWLKSKRVTAVHVWWP